MRNVKDTLIPVHVVDENGHLVEVKNDSTIKVIEFKRGCAEQLGNEGLSKLLCVRSTTPKDVAKVLGCTVKDAECIMLHCKPALCNYKTTRVKPFEFYRQILRVHEIPFLKEWIEERTRIKLDYYEKSVDMFFSLDEYFEFVEVDELTK